MHDIESTSRPRRERDPVTALRTAALSGVAAVAGAAAPAALTGRPAVDMVERALIAGLFACVVAHGRRSTLLVAAALVVPFARGPSLALLLMSLGASVLNLTRPRRVKEIGAVAAGGVIVAVLHLPDVGLHPIVAAALTVGGLVVFVAAARHLRRRHRRMIRRGALVLAAVLFAGVALAGVAAVRAAPSSRSGAETARRALQLIRDGDTSAAARLLEDARTEVEDGRDAMRIGSPAAIVPGLAQQMRAVEIGLEEAGSIAAVADDLLDTDYEDLRYEGRVVLDDLRRLAPGVERIEAVLTSADERLAEVVASPIVGFLRTPLEDFHETVVDARSDIESAARILPELPALLGGEGPRRYLIVFTTPAELRGAGGFIGSWAELSLVDGHAQLSRSGRIRDLVDYGIDTGRVLRGPADYLRRYGRFGVENLVQDTTLSPDWPSVAEVLASTYPQAGGNEVDGVIAIDPSGLASLLRLTGPVQVEGLDVPLDADGAESFLLRDQYLSFGERAAREDVLAEATAATFEALTTASLPSPRELGDVLGPAVRGRHLQLWMRDDIEQQLMAFLGADAALRIPSNSDGWQIVQQNVGNNKIDAHLQRELDYDLEIDPATGRLRGTLTITLRNQVPSLDLPPIVIDNSRGAPLGSNLATLSIHTHLVVTTAWIDGSPIVLGSSSEAGMPVWDTPLLTIPPGGLVTVELAVEGSADLASGYRLLVLPQPTANPDRLRVRLRSAGGGLTARSVEDHIQIRSDGKAIELEALLLEPVELIVDPEP